MKKNYFITIKNAPLFLKFSKAIHLPNLKILVFLFLFLSSFTATYAQSCNVVKGGDFPSAASATSNWSIPSTNITDQTGWHYASGEAYIYRDGIDGVMVPPISLKQTLTGLIVDPLTNSLTISFKIKGQNAGRVAGCLTTATLVVKLGNTTYLTVVNPVNNSEIIQDNITLSNGANSLITENIPMSVISPISQGTITFKIPWTAGITTADLEFAVTSSNSQISCAAKGGDDWYLDDIKVEPSSPTVAGLTICQGTTPGISTSLTSLSICSNGDAISSGAKEARTGGQITRTSGRTWIDPVNITTAGTPYANLSVNNNNGAITNYLTGTNYDFSGIPSNAMITGITAVINRSGNGTGIVDSSIRIVKAGSVIGDEKSTGTPWSTNGVPSAATFGGSSDLWGTTWTVAEIQNSNFGIALSAGITTSSSRSLNVDYMRLTVTYSVPGSINWYTVSSGGTVVQSGNTFNPINDAEVLAQGGQYASLTNTNTPGTYTFYAACSTTPDCRTQVNFIVRETPRATISGAATVCQGGAAPNVTFTNPINLPITVTYNINGATASTINVGASTTATVSAPTGTSGTFTYNLVSAVYQTNPTCSATLTGSAIITVRPTVTASISGAATVCQGGAAPNVTFTNPINLPITVTYNINGGTASTINVGASTTATVSAPTGTSGTFTYNLVSAVYQTNPTCSATLTGSATVTVRPTVTASISGAATVCQGGAAPNVTFTNPINLPITVTYNINGGTASTINVGASTTATVSAPTGTSGTFTYNLVSAVYQINPTCSATLTGSAIITVLPTVTASISGAATVCQGGAAPNVTFTNPINLPITVTYNINGGTASTINVGANTTATVSAPTGTSGTFTYNLVSAVYQTNPTCSATLTGSAIITVLPTVTASISGAATVCQGGAAPNVTFTNPINLPITVTYNINGGTASTINVGASTTATVSAPTGTSGTFTYNLVSAVYQTNPTCSATLTGSATVTVNSVTTPTAVVTAQPNCSELTGTITLSGLPSSGTINQTIGGVTTSIPVSGGGTQSITGLAAGSYTFTVSNASCTSAVSNQVTIIPFSGAIAKWDGTNWSSTPTINDRVEFNTSYSSGTNAPANVDACSCYVNNNAKVTFNLGHTLNVLNEVVVNEGTGITAALLFEDKASLVQHKDVPFKPNSGSITYKRKTSITRFDYTYWSSPVVGRTLKQLSPNTLFDRYFIYNNGWVVSRSGMAEMFAGLGYIARGPQPYSTTVATDFTGEFIGKPHNGVYNGNDLAVVPNRDYLLGNPYPSAIDADKFLNDVNNAAILQGTIYFWTHNTEPVATSGTTTYKYNSSDYASYNKTGGTGTGGVIAGTGGKIPNGKIGAGQGFFARAIGTGNVLFNNSMRLAATQTTYLDNSQFFKVDTGKNAVAAVTTTEKNRVWLNLTNTEGAFKQILVGYITGATNEYDNGFDGVTYNGNSFVDFYSVNQDKNLVIQGRALPFVKKDSVALGYNTTIKGDFKISIDQVDGIFTTQNVLLEDKELKVQHDLKKEAYTFTTEKGTFNNRFVLRYVDKNVVDEVIIPEVPGEDSNTAVMVSVNEGEIRINSTLTKLDKVVVYDVTGRKLFQKNKIDANVLLIPHFVWNHQVLVVDVVLIDGTKVSKKIIN